MSAGRTAMPDDLPPELEAIERYLRERAARELRPDPTAIERVRSSVVAASRSLVAAPASRDWDIRATPAGALPWTRSLATSVAGARGRPSIVRRSAIVAGFATAMTIATIAGPAWVFASESVPGHALYQVRVAAETIGLAPVGTPERAIAEARRLGTRIAELREQVDHRDWPGAAAALGAARAEASDVERALAAAPVARRSVHAALGGIRADLEALERDRDLPRELRLGQRALERELDRVFLGRDTR